MIFRVSHQAGDWGRASVWGWILRQEKIDVPALWSSSRKNSLSLRGWSALLFCSGLQLIGWGPPTLGRAMWFIYSSSFNVNIIHSTLTDTHRIIFDQISGHPMAKSTWHLKLTILYSKKLHTCPAGVMEFERHCLRWRMFRSWAVGKKLSRCREHRTQPPFPPGGDAGGVCHGREEPSFLFCAEGEFGAIFYSL